SVLATGLERRVIGQPRATEAAVDVLLRVRAGLVDPGRPHAVYLLTGPTGTGKTELARAIAEALYSDEQRLLRFDMAEHGTPDAVARLIGDSWRPDGVLTRAVREQPFAVVLLDEIDKAHPSVLNLLLQLLDDGRLGNAAGEMADFRHTVVVMTSNLGASAVAPVGFLPPTGGATTEAIRAVAEHLSPELFNRIDRVVAFEPLSQGTARRVAAKELGSLIRRRGLSDRRVFATATTGLLDLAVEQGFDSRGGARTVKRWLEDHVATPLAEHVAARPAAPLAWVRLHRKASEVGVRYDALVERSAPSEPSSLEDVVDLPLADLRSVAGGAHAALDRLAASEPFAAMKERSSELLARAQSGDRDAATALHSVDELRETLRTVRGVLSNRRAGHDDLIRAVALARFLPHVTSVVENPASHSVRLELSRMGAASRPRMGVGRAPDGMLEWLARAYASHGKLVAFATSPRRDFPLAMTGHDAAALESAFLAGTEDAVLDLEGLGISLLLAGEHGSHLWESVAGGAEVVRVLVSPLEGASSPPAAVIEAHHARLGAFERALEGGEQPLPEDPGALLPAVRRLRFDLPRLGSGGAPYDVALEDYGLAHVASLRVASPIPVLERALLLRMGRVG
ncbi:MAG: ATP-dependent Clp protease ATP-binding subunit, partial [Deltaproteobacteria bacterium]|nr:ATP-dependent Clp protease ATP-binding subunit [Deltaproteobacteria bacterium]